MVQFFDSHQELGQDMRSCYVSIFRRWCTQLYWGTNHLKMEIIKSVLRSTTG